MEEFLTAIANYGFPIIITVYLLVEWNKIRYTREAINDLNHNIEKLIR